MRFLPPGAGKLNVCVWLVQRRPVVFLQESEGRGGDQGESKNAALDLLQDLVGRAHRQKLSGYGIQVAL